MRTKHRRSRRKTRKGGSKYFYPYNTKPIMFTNVSNKQQGGDARGTLFPTFLTNIARDTGYQFHKAYNAGMGKYEPVNPSPLSQNLFKR
jgi:hypothetical protein